MSHATGHPFDLIKVADIQKCHCYHESRPLYEQLFGDYADAENEVMAYNSCKHTIYAAAKRQMKAAPTPDPAIADDFLQYAKEKIDEEVGEDLTHFGYSYQDWYNHLELRKQKDMDLYSRYLIDATTLTAGERKKCEQLYYEGICKVELQKTNGKPRMVCSIPLRTKYVMGPITWMLEEIFSHKFRGYCGGKNLTEMSNMINQYIDQGFTKVVEGDGSAFDNTQDITLKRVDHYLYDRVAHAVHHVDKELFLQVSKELYKTMDVAYYDRDKKKKITLFQYKLLGSVFSGDCDTTLCNTIRMALYNRYVNDKAGLKYGEDYVCFSKGDDFTVMYKDYITDDQINKIYYKYFLPANPDPKKADKRVFGLGQVLKMLDIGGPESIKFCSLRAWVIDKYGHIILTRDPSKFTSLSKYSRKTKTYKIHQVIAYLLDQALALDVNYHGLQYFDAMSQSYKEKAYQLLKLCGTTKRERKVIIRQVFNKLPQRLKESRRAESSYASQETPAYTLINNVCHREEQYKIVGDYWTTMQRIEKRLTTQLTPQQLELANQQINAEYSVEELKSSLGLKI